MSRLFLGLAALALLSACGLRNGLERPNPMWNSANAIEHDCARIRTYNADHPAHPRPLDHRCGHQPGDPTPAASGVMPAHSPTSPRDPATPQ